MTFTSIRGGFNLSAEDLAVVNKQKALTGAINSKFIQVGAVFLKPASKHPVDEDWYSRNRGDIDLQQWIDSEEIRPLNVGFNLQQGWLDIDIDASDPEFNSFILSGLNATGVDGRFAFGRRSVGTPTHILVQLPEEESRNFDQLTKFEPKQFQINGKHYHVQLRSFPVNVNDKNIVKSAKQTVVPGSVYSSKISGQEYDVSVWYNAELKPASNIRDIADTTPRRATFNQIVRGVAFGTIAYCIRNHWVEGSRQSTATKLTGWLSRVVVDSMSMNDHDIIANDVFCPVDSDAIAESLIHFICKQFNDDEPHMRVRAYYDAREKLERNPDAKVPGWHSMMEMLGGEAVMALRTVVMPGNDVSKLTTLVERYIYDETDNKYIDRTRHGVYSQFTHEGNELERRHRGDVIFVGGKPREAFRIFESSTLRKRVGFRDMYPDFEPGYIFRVNMMSQIVPDEEDSNTQVVFNTWKGWPIKPAAVVDEERMTRIVGLLDKLLGYLTCDNTRQGDWVKRWIAWIFQHPGDKQQIAWVCVGGQGVGKSFFGNYFMKALLTNELWGAVAPKILDQNFTVGPFKDKMFVFIDEADFNKNPQAADEIKKLIRNTETSGMEKFEEARVFRIFARMMFASNRTSTGISERDVRDRALFYTRAYDEQYMKMTEMQFRVWTETLKPFFDDFQKELCDPASVSHFIRYFLDLPTNRHELESIQLSSSNDPEIALANMSWARRVAKAIVESGWVAAEDLAWECPFDTGMFAERVAVECKKQGMIAIRPDNVMHELNSIMEHVTDMYNGARRRMMRPNNKWKTSVENYQVATGLVLSPYREFEDGEEGKNATKFSDRPRRTGIRIITKF